MARTTPFEVYTRRSRTGSLTGVYFLGAEDSPIEAESGDRWAAACLDHDVIVVGPTRKGMSAWASSPHLFCPVCHAAHAHAASNLS